MQDKNFDCLAELLVNILCFFETDGFLKTVFEKVSIPEFISKPLIVEGINLILQGSSTSKFHFLLEFKFYEILNRKNLSNDDIKELILVKQSFLLIRELNVNDFFDLINTICSREKNSEFTSKFEQVFGDKFI